MYLFHLQKSQLSNIVRTIASLTKSKSPRVNYFGEEVLFQSTKSTRIRCLHFLTKSKRLIIILPILICFLADKVLISEGISYSWLLINQGFHKNRSCRTQFWRGICGIFPKMSSLTHNSRFVHKNSQ